MTYATRGNSFPIKSLYFQSKFFSVHESGIYLISPQFGSRLCFEARKPIIDVTLLSDGTLIVLDGNLYALRFQNESFRIITDINCKDVEIVEISSKGQRFIAFTYSGKMLYYNFNDYDIILKHALVEKRPSGTILAAGMLDDNFSFCYKSDLETLSLLIYCENNENSPKIIDSIELSGLQSIQGHISFEDGAKIDFIAFNGDLLSKTTWNKASRSHIQSIYKIKTRYSCNVLASIIAGEKYMINDVACPSFILFSASSEVTIGVLIENYVKFWTVNCETFCIESALYSEEMCVLYLNSREKSGFYTFDTKHLKMTLYSEIETYGISSYIQDSKSLKSNGQSLICLSLNKKNIYSLNRGIIPNLKLITDSVFRGISKLWVMKRHHQDLCHEYLVMSSENSTLVFKLEDYVLSDVTNILNIDRNTSTKAVFNLKNSSCAVHVTAKTILILDLSKIDSVGCEVIKFQFNNYKGPWDLVYHHEFYLFCFSQRTNTIDIFQLKNRTRDANLVAPFGTISLETLGIYEQEFTSFIGKISDREFEIVLSSVSGYVHQFIFDLELNIKSKSAVNIGKTCESIENIKIDSSMEIYIGTRSGELFQVCFKNLSVSKIEQIGNSPIKLLKLFNNTLMAYSHDSSILLRQDSKECIKRQIGNWGCEAAVELVYGFGKTYIAGIKDESLYLIYVPVVSENTLSKRPLFSDSSFSAFLYSKTGKWLLACTNIQEKKNFVKLFDSNGTENSSIDRGSDEIMQFLSIDSLQNTFIIVSITRDRLRSKIEMIDIESLRIETISEYICDGPINKIKISGRFLFYSVNEEIFVLEICVFSKRFLGRASYHFRNLIMDFDLFDNQILISCYSDGLDVLSLIKDTNGSIKLISSKGDKFSRSCISCLWLGPNKFVVSDKRNTVTLCRINENSRWIETVKSISFNELIIKIFIIDTKVHGEFISGSIIDISKELE